MSASDRGPIIYGLESQGRSLTARTLAARTGDTDNIHFLVGTQSLRQENQLHLLEYCDDTGVLDKTVYPYSSGEIWCVRVYMLLFYFCVQLHPLYMHKFTGKSQINTAFKLWTLTFYRNLSCSPYDADLFASVHCSVVEGKSLHTASLWRLGPEEGGEGVLQHTSDLDLDGRSARWWVSVCVWGRECECDGVYPCPSTVWHPSSSPQLIVVDDKNVSLIKLDQDKPQVSTHSHPPPHTHTHFAHSL